MQKKKNGEKSPHWCLRWNKWWSNFIKLFLFKSHRGTTVERRDAVNWWAPALPHQKRAHVLTRHFLSLSVSFIFAPRAGQTWLRIYRKPPYMFIVMCQIDFQDEHTKPEARINTSCMCLVPPLSGAQCHIHLRPVSPNARSDSFPCLSVWKSFPFLLF